MIEQNLTITKGDDISWQLYWWSNGVPLDVAGAKLWFTAKTNRGDGDPGVISQIYPNIVTPTVGQYTFILPHSVTAVAAGTYYYDFQMLLNGKITTLGKGVLTVEEDITDATS